MSENIKESSFRPKYGGRYSKMASEVTIPNSSTPHQNDVFYANLEDTKEEFYDSVKAFGEEMISKNSDSD